MDESSIEAEISRQMRITTLSGRAIRKLETLVENLSAITQEANTHKTVRYEGIQELSELPYDIAMDMVEATTLIYNVMYGLRKLHTPAQLPENPNTPITPRNIEELVKDTVGISEDQYALQPEEDARKELNRLRIINAIYDAIFREFANYATTIQMAAGPLRHRELEEREGKQIVTLDPLSMKSIMEETPQFVDAVREKKQLLIRREQESAVTLYDLVQSVSRMATVYYAPFGINLHVDDIPRDVKIKGDVYDITQALLNLLMDKSYVLREVERPEVNLRCVSLKGKIALYIKDNGPNIPHERLEVIFETAEMQPRRTCSDPTVALQSIEESGGEVHVRNSVPPPGVEMEICLLTEYDQPPAN
ncbi:hypothetical protein HZB90_01230 [archaeon]|nr:hypothetical protein [archaeon]